METKIVRHKGSVELLCGKFRLAEMIHFHHTGWWLLTDIRLSKKSPTPFSIASATDYWTVFTAQSEASAVKIRSLLHSYLEEPDFRFNYCTFDGIVCGEDIRNDQVGNNGFFQGGYFKYADGLDYLREVKEFWNTCDNLGFKLPNPKIQLNDTQLYFQVRNL